MATAPSLCIVARLAEDARTLLDISGGPTLSLVALRRLCDELDGSHALAVPAQVGIGAVASPGSVLGPARMIVWWGFTRDSAPMPPRLRLSGLERARLQSLGVTPPDFGRLMEGEAARWRRPLEMAEEALVWRPATPASPPSRTRCGTRSRGRVESSRGRAPRFGGGARRATLMGYADLSTGGDWAHAVQGRAGVGVGACWCSLL